MLETLEVAAATGQCMLSRKIQTMYWDSLNNPQNYTKDQIAQIKKLYDKMCADTNK